MASQHTSAVIPSRPLKRTGEVLQQNSKRRAVDLSYLLQSAVTRALADVRTIARKPAGRHMAVAAPLPGELVIPGSNSPILPPCVHKPAKQYDPFTKPAAQPEGIDSHQPVFIKFPVKIEGAGIAHKLVNLRLRVHLHVPFGCRSARAFFSMNVGEFMSQLK